MNWQENEEPTVDEMRKFAEQFTEEEWSILIKNNNFIKWYDTNLNIVASIAGEILNK